MQNPKYFGRHFLVEKFQAGFKNNLMVEGDQSSVRKEIEQNEKILLAITASQTSCRLLP